MPPSDTPANPMQVEALSGPSLQSPRLNCPPEPVSLEGTRDVKQARQFRPDVAGLRGIAVLLVVLFHAGLSQLSGGFVGVDVFFVISGFVITGVLLRERAKTNGTSLLGFYARRARRILPAATVVIIVTVLISYRWLGFIAGNQVAQDDKAAALFFANFHFISMSTNYFTSRLPPSPLQHYWSLSVEEQFYLLYPTIFLCVALVWRRVPIVRKLAVVLLAVIEAPRDPWRLHFERKGWGHGKAKDVPSRATRPSRQAGEGMA